MRIVQPWQDEGEALHSALDFAYLARQTLGDAGLQAELLRAFQIQAQAILRQLRESPQMTARAKADLAHLLKGSARAIGAIRVGLASETYEAHAADPGPAAEAALGVLAKAIVEASGIIDRSFAEPSREERPARRAPSAADPF